MHNTISGSPVLLKALQDKQNNPNLSFRFELPSSDDHRMPNEQQMDEESDEELSEMQSADESDHEFLHWGVTKKLSRMSLLVRIQPFSCYNEQYN